MFDGCGRGLRGVFIIQTGLPHLKQSIGPGRRGDLLLATDAQQLKCISPRMLDTHTYNLMGMMDDERKGEGQNGLCTRFTSSGK